MKKLPLLLLLMVMTVSCGLSGLPLRAAEPDKAPAPVHLPVPTPAPSRYFPIANFGDKGQGISASEEEWYAKSLKKMAEPVLMNGVAEAAVVYRFLILPTWGNSIAIRAVKGESGYELISKRLDGQAGYDEGKLVEERKVKLSKADGEKLEELLLQKLQFFKLPTVGNDHGNDGEEWLLEGVVGGKYHLLVRWGAAYEMERRQLGAFVDVCRFLVDKSGLSQRPKNGNREVIPAK
jgi:hypothetical protein